MLCIKLICIGNIYDSLAIITTGKGAGSGFLVTMESKKYLITNEHVLRGGLPLKVQLLNGRTLSFKSLEIATDRDLVRLEVATPNLSYLEFSSDGLNIGDKVTAYGNSGGSGVATKLDGKILGIGPILIEVDAQVISGNSGCPILDTKTNVVAIVTKAIKETSPENWIIKGTRFEDVRRFGTRANSATWKPVTSKQYYGCVNYIEDIQTFCYDFFDLWQTDVFYEKITKRYVYNKHEESSRYAVNKRLCSKISDNADLLNSIIDASVDLKIKTKITKITRDPTVTSSWYNTSDGSFGFSISSVKKPTVHEQREAERIGQIRKMQLSSYLEKYVQSCRQSFQIVENMDLGKLWATKQIQDEYKYWLYVARILTESHSKEVSLEIGTTLEQ